MGETNMPDNDPGVLARELLAPLFKVAREYHPLGYYLKLRWEPATFNGEHDITPAAVSQVAVYLESLSAPVEDEEKVCREILAAEAQKRKDHDMWNWATHYAGVNTHVLVALAAMREYASRLRAPVPADDEAGLTAPQIVLWINERIRILKQWLGDNPEAKLLAVARSEVRSEIAKLGLFAKAMARAPAGVTVGEPALTGLEPTDEMVLRAFRIYEPNLYGKRGVEPFIAKMRVALTAALQACEAGGSLPSPKQTSELATVTDFRAVCQSVHDQLEGGFMRCDHCGEQQDTKDMDVMYELRSALSKQTSELEEAGNALALGKGSLAK